MEWLLRLGVTVVKCGGVGAGGGGAGGGVVRAALETCAAVGGACEKINLAPLHSNCSLGMLHLTENQVLCQLHCNQIYNVTLSFVVLR